MSSTIKGSFNGVRRSGTNGSSALEQKRKTSDVARKETRTPERTEAEPSRSRDGFESQATRTRRNLPLLAGRGAEQAPVPIPGQQAFRMSSFGPVLQAPPMRNPMSTSDAAARTYIEGQFQEKLGRPCEDSSRLLAEARASGAQTHEEVRAYIDHTIDGSPEKAALNTINSEFESKLGRSLSVSEQATWLRESGLSPTDPNFAAQVSSRIRGSEEYQALHPNAAAMSPEDAFILQFYDPKYNPTGPGSSTNCGPASLAMAMNYTGNMPPGLTKEQQVDHARALMHPELAGSSALTFVKDANGNDVPLLNRDKELTGGTMEEDGIRAAGGSPAFGQGWDALDRALEDGPVLGNGYLGPSWREQFPARVGSGDVGHVNCILGKTPEGKYIVADPMHTGGPVEMTREQLSVFFPRSNGEPTFASTGLGAGGAPVSGPAAPVTAGAADGASPEYAFNARAFPGFYDASKDSDAIYNIAKMATDAPGMWADYGASFKKVGQELGVDPHALAAYCAFESYRGDWGTFNPNAGAQHGNMVAAGIAQTQAQDWAGREVPGLAGTRFPQDISATAAMLKQNPEYSLRCLATVLKEKYDNNGQDLAKALPLAAYPSWGDPSIRRGAYGDQPTYVSRAFVLYNAFRQADGLPPA